MPVIDLDTYLKAQQGAELDVAAQEECRKVAECFHRFGIILIRDPRADMADNDEYIDLMEEYFARRGDQFYAGEPISDIKPEYHY